MFSRPSHFSLLLDIREGSRSSLFIMSSLRPVVLSGPSGAGKSTLLKMIMDNFPQSFAFSISHTTRKPRPGEVQGKDYHFVTEEQMLKDIEDGKFLEYAQFAGNYYGTPREAVTAVSFCAGFRSFYACRALFFFVA